MSHEDLVRLHGKRGDTLYWRDPKTGKLVPSLAEPLRNVGPTSWKLKLRRGVRFHSGEPFDAEALKFNVERILNPVHTTKVDLDFHL